ENISGEAARVRLKLDGTSTMLRRGYSVVTAGGVIGASVARDGRTAAVIHSGVHHPPEIWTGPIEDWKQLTHINNMNVSWGHEKSIHWRSDDFDVQGWLIPPPNVDPSKKYPMIVYVHGGPALASLANFPREQNAALLDAGYFLFLPNPRGSYGQGEAFTRANVKDFGHGDLRDIVAGVEAVVKDNPIDRSRIGMWGWSYGGFMITGTVTPYNRFRAAVAGAGIANWQSYY